MEDLLAFLPVESFPALVRRCLDELEALGHHDGAERILCEVAVQAGSTFYPHLERIIDLWKTGRFPMLLQVSSAWRELDWQTTAPLRRVIAQATQTVYEVRGYNYVDRHSLQILLLDALLESKDRYVIEYALTESRRRGEKQVMRATEALRANGVVYENGSVLELRNR